MGRNRHQASGDDHTHTIFQRGRAWMSDVCATDCTSAECQRICIHLQQRDEPQRFCERVVTLDSGRRSIDIKELSISNIHHCTELCAPTQTSPQAPSTLSSIPHTTMVRDSIKTVKVHQSALPLKARAPRCLDRLGQYDRHQNAEKTWRMGMSAEDKLSGKPLTS